MQSEFELIESIKRYAGVMPAGVIGIGDDCAVIEQPDGSSLLITVDTMVEERHFSLVLSKPEQIGWKLLACSLSDIAAMGGSPLAAVISITLRANLTPDFVAELYWGLRDCAQQSGTLLVGGDTTKGKELSLSMTVIGRAKQPVLRSGAQEGDDVWVSGTIGDGSLGLLAAQGKLNYRTLDLSRYHQPLARSALGLGLSGIAHAMIDVSDGLLQDTLHLARASNLRITLYESQLPVRAEVRASNEVFVRALTGGDDYELVFTAPQSMRQKIKSLATAQVPVTLVGTVEAGIGLYVRGQNGLILAATDWVKTLGGSGSLGFDHFK